MSVFVVRAFVKAIVDILQSDSAAHESAPARPATDRHHGGSCDLNLASDLC
jgi:hypothetical protein